jgi:hypothetical protein
MGHVNGGRTARWRRTVGASRNLWQPDGLGKLGQKRIAVVADAANMEAGEQAPQRRPERVRASVATVVEFPHDVCAKRRQFGQ